MRRKSSSIEERARDALQDFLLTLQRRPLELFLRLYFPDGLPQQLTRTQSLRVEKEVETNLESRVDLVITAQSTLLFVEVKVDAVEQVGQYEKYKRYFESQGYVVVAGGLINRLRRSYKKDNAAFLEALGVRRVYWSEVLDRFRQEFGETKQFRVFLTALSAISPAIGASTPIQIAKARHIERDPTLLPVGNEFVCHFYKDLIPRLNGMEGTPWQHGNSRYCLMFGKPSWREKFQEEWFYRSLICFERNASEEPQFKLSVMLWNRSWTKNITCFSAHRTELVDYFTRLGFDVGRNAGSGWHRRISWLPPYDIKGLKYANAFWKPRIVLHDDDHTRLSWDALLKQSTERCFQLANIVDGFPNG